MLNFVKKEFLLGVGTGFIISGIMVAFLGIGQPTDEEIMAKAAKLGMVRTVESMKGETQSSTQEPVKSTSKMNSSAKTNPSEPAASTGQTASTGPAALQTPEQAGQSSQKLSEVSGQAADKEVRTVTIEVRPGMGSETVARILEEKEVIKDREEFYKLITAHKAHSSFRVGNFEVPVGGDMEEILKILTGK